MRQGMLSAMLAACLSVSGACAYAQSASPDAFPKKVVRLLVGYGPGGSTDLIARALAQRLSERWGVQVVVDNRAGGDTIIATDLTAKAQPDGYTLLMANSTNATNPSVHKKLPYDPVRDFTSIAMVGAAPNLLSTNPAFPANSIKELIALAKARPAEFTYGTVGAGSSQHLLMEHFAARARIKVTHVPYKSGGAAIIDTMAGHISGMLSGAASQEGYVRAGKLKPLVVFSAKRSPALPQVPTIVEAGYPDLQSEYWMGVVGPARLPAAVVARLNSEINAVLQVPEMREHLAKQGVEPMGGSARDMDEFYRKELALWADVVRDAGIERK